MANYNIFQNASNTITTCNSAIPAGATSITLANTAGIGTVLANQQMGAVILDTGNPGYSAANPLATNYEYIYITGNNLTTNTLTITRGQDGSSATSFFAGATIIPTLLAGALTAAMARLDMTGLFTQGFGTASNTPTLSNVPAGISNPTLGGNNIAGTIRLDTTGSPPSAGRVATITIAGTLPYTPKAIILSPSNSISGNTTFNGFVNRPYVSNRSTTLWEISYAAPQANTASEWDFLVVM
jgi:hypothetical protein